MSSVPDNSWADAIRAGGVSLDSRPHSDDELRLRSALAIRKSGKASSLTVVRDYQEAIKYEAIYQKMGLDAAAYPEWGMTACSKVAKIETMDSYGLTPPREATSEIMERTSCDKCESWKSCDDLLRFKRAVSAKHSIMTEQRVIEMSIHEANEGKELLILSKVNSLKIMHS
ncbi:hypothetical protein [Singulisphaera acidiphila]|uniref:Uncharacterized protein n=1 Tax=Singulisphaera acidiphila (strain ATCC BAA-1392 / DSM 18658 / VKM B-2454 / MOB10) TaxID=886293 RepID=L0D9U8_SINAD|nr:hypothetical protein [Singulisphaera acidiphila]AGA26017.1 hypothetical protein Sinac_1639 [Singulisphaera acidiphila DSM 18658]